MLEGKAKYYERRTKSSIVPTITVSAKLARDSQWPFKHKEALHVKIDPKNERVIISKEAEK